MGTYIISVFKPICFTVYRVIQQNVKKNLVWGMGSNHLGQTKSESIPPELVLSDFGKSFDAKFARKRSAAAPTSWKTCKDVIWEHITPKISVCYLEEGTK